MHILYLSKIITKKQTLYYVIGIFSLSYKYIKSGEFIIQQYVYQGNTNEANLSIFIKKYIFPPLLINHFFMIDLYFHKCMCIVYNVFFKFYIFYF